MEDFFGQYIWVIINVNILKNYCHIPRLFFKVSKLTSVSGVSSSNNGFGSLPVISAYSTLAPQMAAAPPVDPKPVQQPAPIPQPPQIQVQTVKELVKETHVLPPEMPTMTNKGLQTKPFMVSKSTSAKPVGVNQSTQTDAPVQPTIIPLPVPINIPTPCKMYNAPFPVPVPIPLPFPVPIFIPTTRNSMKGIMKQIKKIQNKIPADPFEAELLALAGNMADEDKDSDSEEDVGKNISLCCCCLPCNHCSNWTWVVEEIFVFCKRLRSTPCRYLYWTANFYSIITSPWPWVVAGFAYYVIQRNDTINDNIFHNSECMQRISRC